MTDEQYRNMIIERFDQMPETERREIFRRALIEIDHVAARHWEVVDAYERLLK